MKFSHALKERKAGPCWGLAFGLLMTVACIGLWCDEKLSASTSPYDKPLGIAALLIGVSAAIYAVHELRPR